MTNAGPPPPDTTEMLAIHKIFRTALADAPRLIGNVPVGDTERAALVGGYYEEVLTILDLHHAGEDALVWPKLYERAPAHAEIVGTAEGQHKEIHEPLSHANVALEAWQASPDPQRKANLLAALEALSGGLLAHLDNEEKTVLPLIGEHLTIEEWGELPAHAMQSYPGERVWMVLGLARENMTQAQRDMMLAHMPPPAVEMWTTTGEATFDDYIRRVRAG